LGCLIAGHHHAVQGEQNAKYLFTKFQFKRLAKTQDSPKQIDWQVSPSDTVAVEFKQPTDFQRDVLDPDMRLEFEQFVAQSGGALVDFEVTKIMGVEAVRQVCKFWHPAPKDMRKVYLGTLAFPFAEFCYIVRVQCIETGTTGLQEAAVSLIVSQGKPAPPASEPIVVKSMEELFDRMKKAPVTRVLSDDEEYDAQFPDHPLTKARRYLKHLAETLVIDPALQKAEPYRIRTATKPDNLVGKIPGSFR